MESLLQAADALVAQHMEKPPRPDFELPEEAPQPERWLACQESSKGRGWYATTNIAAGTLLLMDKPLVMVMDWQDEEDDTSNHHEEDQDEDDDKGVPETRLNELLLLEILKRILEDPSLWTGTLSNLFPRDDKTASDLPVLVCRDDLIFLQIEALLQEMETAHPELPVRIIAKRLPLVIRYNALSIETCPELLVHPGPAGHAALTGTGLFFKPSFFNHNPRPNVSRYSVGDICYFVANQDIRAGKEACISYLEHDVLCESPSRRTRMLDLDFYEDGDEGGDEDMASQDANDGPELPVVDSDVQNELMQMDPLARLSDIAELLKQATGVKAPEEADEMEEGEPSAWFQCDAHNLRIIRAITLDGLGQTQEALESWEECVVFTETKLPPNDEVSVVMRVQAALCAHHSGDMGRARLHASKALETHNLLFGGGVSRFRRRYQRELLLALRPVKEGSNAPDDLWPMGQSIM